MSVIYHGQVYNLELMRRLHELAAQPKVVVGFDPVGDDTNSFIAGESRITRAYASIDACDNEEARRRMYLLLAASGGQFVNMPGVGFFMPETESEWSSFVLFMDLT